MVSGIIILDTGLVQVFGNPTTLRPIIQHMREVIPQLELEERRKLLDSLSEDDLSTLLAQKKGTHANNTSE